MAKRLAEFVAGGRKIVSYDSSALFQEQKDWPAVDRSILAAVAAVFVAAASSLAVATIEAWPCL